MPSNLIVDFIGMVVVVHDRAAGQLSVGCLDEPGHMHTIHGFDREGLVRIAPLRLRCPGVQTLAATGGGATELADNGRLFDVAALVPARAREAIESRFVTRFDLRGGRLEALPAHIGDAQSTWRMPDSDATFHLTDRLRYTATVAGDVVLLDRVGLAARGSEIHAVVTAVDGDYGRREAVLEAGFPLTEFVHFYGLTRGYGPIPVAAPRAVGVNPDLPTCPAGFITL